MIPTSWEPVLKTITGWINDGPIRVHPDAAPETPPIEAAYNAAFIAIGMRDTGYVPPDQCTATDGVIEFVVAGEGRSFIAIHIDEWGFRVLKFDVFGVVSRVSLAHTLIDGLWPIDSYWPKVVAATQATP